MYKHSHVGVIEQVQPSRIDSFDQMGGPRSEPSHIQNKWLLILQRLQLGPPVLSSNATLRLTIGNRPTACVLFNINGADPEFGIGVILPIYIFILPPLALYKLQCCEPKGKRLFITGQPAKDVGDVLKVVNFTDFYLKFCTRNPNLIPPVLLPRPLPSHYIYNKCTRCTDLQK